MSFYVEDFPSHCGSVIFHSFDDGPEPEEYTRDGNDWKEDTKTMFAIFINRSDQKKAYDYLKEEYKILYQSPILVNPVTGRQYFIVIYLNEKP